MEEQAEKKHHQMVKPIGIDSQAAGICNLASISYISTSTNVWTVE
jgi:hypothetical protein